MQQVFFGQLYQDTTNSRLYQKTRGGYFSGTDSANFGAIAMPNPTTQSFSFVMSLRLYALPSTTTAIYRHRTAGVGFVLGVDAAGDLIWQVSKDGTNKYSATNAGVLRVAPNNTYELVCTWDHLINAVQITMNAVQVSSVATIVSASVDTAHQISSGNSSSWAVEYLARVGRYIPQAEALTITASCAFNAAGGDVVFWPSVSGLTSGSTLPNYGTAGGTINFSDGAPATIWSEWWIPLDRRICGTVG